MLKITTTPNYFNSEDIWIKNKDNTFFKSIDQMKSYQKDRLKYLLNFYNTRIPDSFTSELPILKNQENTMRFARSGTTSINKNRHYFYSSKEYPQVEKHHIWKLEKLHRLESPGNIVWLAPTDYKLIGGHKKSRIYGPEKYLSCGLQNDVFLLLYNHYFDVDDWKYNLDLCKSYNPKYIRASPSVVESIHYLLGDSIKFNCPIVLSEETLNENIRNIAKNIFSKVIDKMLCWDGGLGWVECPYGIKHIYDEFCIVEQLETRQLATTDLNNMAMPFLRYLNGDSGEISTIKCDCGICGNYFKTFDGKTIQSLYANDKLIPGRFLSEKFSVFLRTGKEFSEEINSFSFPNMIYRIKQNKDLSVDFIYCSEIELSELEKNGINVFMNKIIWQNHMPKNVRFKKEDMQSFCYKETRRSKSLFIESDYLRGIKNA
jgi:hypothetical protein